jgi:hypothetical protein
MFRISCRLICCLAILAASAFADVIYNVSIDTSPLIGSSAQPFTLDLQFSDGSGVGDANNTVLLSGFSFGSGAPLGSPFPAIGGVSGDLGSSVTMLDSSFFNEFDQEFTPGAILTFTLDLTTNADIAAPDEFSLGILDSTGQEIPTHDPGNALIVADILAGSVNVSTFATDSTTSPPAGGPPIAIPAPQVTAVSAAPEPGTLLLLSTACLALVRLRRTGSPKS